jgi:hypothetical protein
MMVILIYHGDARNLVQQDHPGPVTGEKHVAAPPEEQAGKPFQLFGMQEGAKFLHGAKARHGLCSSRNAEGGAGP